MKVDVSETNPHNGIKREKKGVRTPLFAATFVFVELKNPREKNRQFLQFLFLLFFLKEEENEKKKKKKHKETGALVGLVASLRP